MKRNLYSTHRLMAPPTVQPCDAVVRLDGLAALVTLACTVTFHPVVVHYLQSQQATLVMLACTVTFHPVVVHYLQSQQATLVMLACTVTFHPVVVHYLQSQQATLVMLACTVTFHQKMVCYPHASRCTFQTYENEHCMFSVPISWACCCYHIRLG